MWLTPKMINLIKFTVALAFSVYYYYGRCRLPLLLRIFAMVLNAQTSIKFPHSLNVSRCRLARHRIPFHFSKIVLLQSMSLNIETFYTFVLGLSFVLEFIANTADWHKLICQSVSFKLLTNFNKPI